MKYNKPSRWNAGGGGRFLKLAFQNSYGYEEGVSEFISPVLVSDPGSVNEPFI